MIAPVTQTCPRCLEERPLKSFRRLKRDSDRRANHCNGCHARLETIRRKSTEQRKQRALMYNTWGALATAHKKRLSVENIVLRLLDRFGGPAQLASAWHDAYAHATSLRRIRAVDSLLRLLDYLEKHRDVLTGYADYTDAQLEKLAKGEAERVILATLKTDPEFVRKILKQAGYTITHAPELEKAS